MKRVRFVAVAGAVLMLGLAGCAGGNYPPEGTLSLSPARCDDAGDCAREVQAKEVELRALLDRIAATPLGTSSPDCASARELRDRICDLASAICTLAARNPGSGELHGRCSSAEVSCSQARDDVAQGCDR
jgi:hypothetical protein